MDVFWRNGYGGTSIGELRDATGLTASSIYNAHGSKQGLLCAALDVYLDLLEENMFGPLAAGSHGTEDLLTLVDRLESTGVRGDGRGCLAVNTLAELRDPPPAVAERLARYLEFSGAAIDRGLADAVAEGELAADSAEQLAGELRAFIVSFNLLATTGAGPAICEAHANTMRASITAKRAKRGR